MIVIKEKEYNSNINLLKNDIGTQGNVYFATFQSSLNDNVYDFYYKKGSEEEKQIFSSLGEAAAFFQNHKTICVADSQNDPKIGSTHYRAVDKYIAFLYLYESLAYQYLYFIDKEGEIWEMKISKFRTVLYWKKKG